MANTSAVYARIDTNLKNEAEAILAKLGITPSISIQMFYSQIIMNQGMPFDVKLPRRGPTCIGGMTEDEIVAEILKGEESLKDGKYSADEIDEMLAREFGI